MDKLTKVVSASGPTYKVYTALLYQEGVNPPTAIILENTLGVDLVWTRTTTGIYAAAYDPSGDCAENADKIFFTAGRSNIDSSPNAGSIAQAYYSNCAFNIVTVNDDTPAIPSDGILWQTPIEIRYYN